MPSLQVSDTLALELATKNGLFDDFACGHCDHPNDLKKIVKDLKTLEDIRFDCEHCGASDLCGSDIIEHAAAEYLDDVRNGVLA